MSDLYRIGIDLGGTTVTAGLVDEENKILHKLTWATALPRPAEDLEQHMAKLCRAVAQQAGVDFAKVASIGIGTPGSVNSKTGKVGFNANFGYHNWDLGSDMEKLLGCRVYVENDANAAAYGEYLEGSAKGYNSAVCVTLGTGIGGGIILDGRIFSGANGAGGEIGHITVDPHETAVCGCGKRGCLEQYSSATGVVRCMKKLLDENPEVECVLRGTDFVAKDVFDAARNGDALASREVEDMSNTLGMALASIASTTDPEMFLVGGGVARAGDVLFDPLVKHFKEYAFRSCRETPIKAASLGNDAGIYGAVRLIVGE